MVHTYHTVYEDYTHYSAPEGPGAGRRRPGSHVYPGENRFVIAPTAKVKKLLESYGVERPVAVIPTGIRLERFLPVSWEQVDEDRNRIREQYGIGEGQKGSPRPGKACQRKKILKKS